MWSEGVNISPNVVAIRYILFTRTIITVRRSRVESNIYSPDSTNRRRRGTNYMAKGCGQTHAVVWLMAREVGPFDKTIVFSYLLQRVVQLLLKQRSLAVRTHHTIIA